jgi:hypothetical protein
VFSLTCFFYLKKSLKDHANLELFDTLGNKNVFNVSGSSKLLEE